MGLLRDAILGFLRLLEFLIFIDAILSWVMEPRRNQLSRLLGTIVDPLLIPCYRLQQRIIRNSPIDFSPLLAIFIIEILRTLVASIF